MFEAEFLSVTNDAAAENEASINQILDEVEQLLIKNESHGASSATVLFETYLTPAIKHLDFKDELGFRGDSRVVVEADVKRGRVTVEIIRVCP